MQSSTCLPSGKNQPATDAELIEAALRGQQSGYEQLMQRYQNRLFVSIRHDVGCPVIAEDIVQEAFVRAFRYLDSFKRQSNFYTWLYRIALNSRRDYIRNRNRMISLDAVSQPYEMSTELRESPAHCTERQEERCQVRAALTRLSDHYRTILILREFEGFNYQRIAEILQVGKGTVRSRLSRARAQLKKELSPYVNLGTAQGHQKPNRKTRRGRHAAVVPESASDGSAATVKPSAGSAGPTEVS